jgi:hypothetical protein
VRAPRTRVVVAVAALLIAAAFAGNAATRRHSTKAPPTRAAQLDAAGANTVWFCPGAPTRELLAEYHVTLANLGSTPANVAVTVLTDKGTQRRLAPTIPANDTVTLKRRALVDPGSVTVEVFGARVVAEEGSVGTHGVESTPCATHAARTWFFAAGTTVRGAQQWLVVDNPYATDAKIDLTYRGSNGVHEAPGVDVPHRGRTVIAVHQQAGVVRAARVAVEVRARVGEVVASQVLVFSAAAGAVGTTWSLGAPAPSAHWTFAEGQTFAGTTSAVAIANVGNDEAKLDVQAVTGGTQLLAAPQVTVPADEVTWVQLGSCSRKTEAKCIAIPDNLRFTLDVRADGGGPVVAQTLQRGPRGVLSSPGNIAPAAQWAFARSRIAGERATTLSVLNPLAAPARVDVSIVAGGRVTRPRALQGIQVEPGRRFTVRVASRRDPATDDGAVIVQSTQPIIAERAIATDDEASVSVGVALG